MALIPTASRRCHSRKPAPTGLGDTLNASTTFGTWLKQARVQRGFDLRSLAATTGVDRSTINRLERDAAHPTVCTAVRLCDGLDVSPAELIQVLQGRATREKVLPLLDEQLVLTAADVHTFVRATRAAPQRSREMLADWLNTLEGAYGQTQQHPESRPLGAPMAAPLQLSRGFIDLLLSDVDFLKSEMQFPPRSDDGYAAELYRRGGALTLRDVGSYIRYRRQAQRKSLRGIGQPLRVSESALSRIETGALEQIRLKDILGVDQELDADGFILEMCWAACRLFPPILKHARVTESAGSQQDWWTAREYRLALTLLAIVRWWEYLRPGDTTLITQIHQQLDEYTQ